MTIKEIKEAIVKLKIGRLTINGKKKIQKLQQLLDKKPNDVG
jgi:hypothetical protein